jgi:26S proteasome regulatory subunit T3
MIDEIYGLVNTTSGTTYLVRVLSILDREKLKPNCTVALHKLSHSVVDILPSEADVNIQMMKVTNKSDVTYNDIGGLDVQKQEIKESIELPLSHPDLYYKLGTTINIQELTHQVEYYSMALQELARL